jgi:hypothetical protein
MACARGRYQREVLEGRLSWSGVTEPGGGGSSQRTASLRALRARIVAAGVPVEEVRGRSNVVRMVIGPRPALFVGIPGAFPLWQGNGTLEDHPRTVVAMLEAVALELRYDLPVCAADVTLRPRALGVHIVLGVRSDALYVQAGEIVKRVMDRVGVRK